MSVKAPVLHFWRVTAAARGSADAPVSEYDDVLDGLADVPLMVEDLLCQIEVLRAVGGDPATVADLWAQVDLLRAR